MKVFQGRSFHAESKAAVKEATQDWELEGSPDVVFLFSSTEQNPQEAAAAAKEHFGDALVIGCTSTGENLAGKHSNGALVVAALQTPKIRWTAVSIPKLSELDQEAVNAATSTLFEALDVDREEIEPHKLFCLNFVDGLRLKEELLCSLLTEALDGVSFVGGSAGDDLKFEETRVFFEGEAFTDAAVLVMGAAEDEKDFHILKHQHFTTTDKRLVITKCDPSKRQVIEIDGFPARDAYARAIGVTSEELNGDHAFLNPVTLSIDNEIYVRSVQSINDDGSLTFYCAIEEGMVMEIGGHNDMTERLRADLGESERGKAKFMLTCNCILRALEAKGGDLHGSLDEVLQDVSETSIGFDTYGEQLDGLHMNQTLVALSLHG